MSSIIAICKITALFVWCVFAGVLTIPFQFGGGWKGIRAISWITRLWCKGVARIINMRVKTSGRVPALSGGLVISNHLGYLDIIAHGSVLPIRFCSRTEIRKWPLIGWYLSLSQPIWADRESKQKALKTLNEFRDTVANGINLLVYPEGTSSDGKQGILPFKSTAFEAAVSSNTAIIPILTHHKEIPGSQTVCWYGDMEFLPHAWHVLKRPRIETELCFLQAVSPEGRTRKELASSIHDMMEREYQIL